MDQALQLAAPPAPAEPARPVEAPHFEGAPRSEIPCEVLSRRICDFDLGIEGRPLGRVIERFRAELHAVGIRRLDPRFYLTDEWGVPEGTVAIGIPFYLADALLLDVQRSRGLLVEGEGEEGVLRYLRHEMGHVVNYAWRLYATEEWTRLFGPMSRPYVEDYAVRPFSPDFVRHLPGGYAQKHPDEDWAETFAVWMTPGLDWRRLYADSPGALEKLEYCARTMKALEERDPEVVDTQIDYEAKDISLTLQEFYEAVELGEDRIPRSLDGDLLAIFARAHERAAATRKGDDSPSGDAAALLKRQGEFLGATAYGWTAVDPATMRRLVRHLETRARELGLRYPLSERDEVTAEVAAFLTALAMNRVYTGRFIAS
jgi:hypothetical protein